jgi:hypothetical protein
VPPEVRTRRQPAAFDATRGSPIAPSYASSRDYNCETLASTFQCRLCGTSSRLRTFEPCEMLAPIASEITRTGRLCNFGRMSRRTSTRSSDPSSRHATRLCAALKLWRLGGAALRAWWSDRDRLRAWRRSWLHPRLGTRASRRGAVLPILIGEAAVAVDALADRQLSTAVAAGIGSPRSTLQSKALLVDPQNEAPSSGARAARRLGPNQASKNGPLRRAERRGCVAQCDSARLQSKAAKRKALMRKPCAGQRSFTACCTYCRSQS